MSKNDYDAAEDSFSGSAGSRVIAKARNIAENFGESFVVFIGSAVSIGNAVAAFRSEKQARTRALEDLSVGIPRYLIKIRRIKF